MVKTATRTLDVFEAFAAAGPMHRMTPRVERHGAALLDVRRALEKPA